MATGEGGGDSWREGSETKPGEDRDAALAMMSEGLATAFQCFEDGMAEKLASLGKEQSALLAKLEAAREVRSCVTVSVCPVQCPSRCYATYLACPINLMKLVRYSRTRCESLALLLFIRVFPLFVPT